MEALPVAEFLQMGGPLGFAGLFAWLWLRAEAKLEALQKEYREFLNRILRKAGYDV